MNEKKQINKGTRQKKVFKNPPKGLAPPPPTAESVEKNLKNQKRLKKNVFKMHFKAF